MEEAATENLLGKLKDAKARTGVERTTLPRDCLAAAPSFSRHRLANNLIACAAWPEACLLAAGPYECLRCCNGVAQRRQWLPERVVYSLL